MSKPPSKKSGDGKPPAPENQIGLSGRLALRIAEVARVLGVGSRRRDGAADKREWGWVLPESEVEGGGAQLPRGAPKVATDSRLSTLG